MLVKSSTVSLQHNNRMIKGGICTMAFQISDACVSCGACESQCPVGAISMGDGKFEIDADKCIDCGSCAGACPTGSIEQA